MNEKYWPEFYKNKEINKPSEFAFFCFMNFLIKREYDNIRLLEVGAGDGRDTKLFSRHIEDLTVIEPNNENVENIGCMYHKKKFENFEKIYHGVRFDYIYARWFLHAVSKDVEDKLIDFAIKNNSIIMLEFRIIGDKPDYTHERRLIDLEKFIKKLLDKGFVIKHLEKGKGLSKVGDNDPLLARVIAEYNG